ncbi:hypothetical protein DVH24_003839 [Malus domestica]|uniref:Uncharacterized protein n=1 Tax=Malus domestica TaxID=3750 RepID=A0A498K767_MALDO|nr:hypothetical protein DVH24_003839 [Malus domestica]
MVTNGRPTSLFFLSSIKSETPDTALLLLSGVGFPAKGMCLGVWVPRPLSTLVHILSIDCLPCPH